MKEYGTELYGASNLMQNKDQFGYYTVGDLKTYSKIEAIELHAKTGIHPQWHFNEEVFSHYDWTIEPVASLEQLYAVRAQQIRQKYDYIVLFFSGGADSENMLRAFLRNNIHIDEIANFWALAGDKEYDTHFNSEIYNIAAPAVRRILETNPNIKHRIIDLTEIIAKLYDDPNRKFDFLYDMNSMFSPNNYARSFLREHINDYQDIIASGKKLCFVWGSEKPRVTIDQGRYCVKFLDILDNVVSSRTQKLNREWEHDELFYWSPELPELLAKQAHTVMRFLKMAMYNEYDFTPKQPRSHFGSIVHQGETKYLTSHGLHKIIYGINNFHNVKPSSTFFSERDTWFHSRPTHLISAQNYIQGIDKLKTILPSYWVNDTFDRGIKGCISQPYWLEK